MTSPTCLPLSFPSLSLDSPPAPLFPVLPTDPTTTPLLQLLPPEIIEQIAFQLARLTPTGPPTALFPFLSVSQRVYSILGPRNEGFYADLFKERFDWKSIERRWETMKRIEDKREKKSMLFGLGKDEEVQFLPNDDLKLTFGSFTRASSPSDLPVSNSVWRSLTSRDWCAEFKRRCTVLTKIRTAAITGVIPPGSSRPSSPRLQATSLAGEYKSAIGEPDELTQNLWTCYLMLLENDGKNLAHLLEYGELRTYMRLFYRHSLMSEALRPGWPRQTASRALGLWIGWLGGDDLSTESPTESDERFFVLKPYVFGAHKFDAFHAPWTIPTLPVTPKAYPLLPAPQDPFTADLRPHTLAQTVVHMGRSIDMAPPILTHAAVFSFFFRVEQDPNSTAGDGGDANFTGSNPLNTATLTLPMPGRQSKPTKTSIPTLASHIHDADFARLASCPDPYSSLGLPSLNSLGTIAGSWEGRFSFFDFDSYRDMLGGRMRSLYEGPFGDQPQVWRVEEKIVKLNDGKEGSTGEWKGGRGPRLNAGFEIGNQGPRSSSVSSGAAGSPTSSHSAPRTASLRRSSNDVLGGGDAGDARGIKRARSLRGHKMMSMKEGEWWDEDERDDDGDYEILLTGSGHSAWGQFLLKGRIRAWDGMFTITKEYTPDSRGRWLYRGYCVGGNLVGRWRDTHSTVDLNGYEGTFMMSRRA